MQLPTRGLARGGMVFDDACCKAPLCVPSRMSMFSGRLPNAIESRDNARELRAETPTRMRHLRRGEYAAAEKELRARAEEDWDGPAVKRRAMAGHAYRDFLRSIPGYMNNQLWKPKVCSPPFADDYGWK